MDFILIEAIEEDDEFKLVFSDDSSDEELSEEEELNFIDDDEGEEQQPSFYGSVDNGERVRFSNQTRNPDEVFDESKDEYYSEDDMPESCTTQKKGKVLNLICLTIILINLRYLKRAFLRFDNVENQLFYAVLYGLLHVKTNGQNVQL